MTTHDSTVLRVSGRPVGERVLLAGQYAGLLLLAGLIGLAFYNDLARILS